MTRLHKPFLEPLGLTFPQYLVMLELFAGHHVPLANWAPNWTWTPARSPLSSNASKYRAGYAHARQC
jgi:hypothetical protein